MKNPYEEAAKQSFWKVSKETEGNNFVNLFPKKFDAYKSDKSICPKMEASYYLDTKKWTIFGLRQVVHGQGDLPVPLVALKLLKEERQKKSNFEQLKEEQKDKHQENFKATINKMRESIVSIISSDSKLKKQIQLAKAQQFIKTNSVYLKDSCDWIQFSEPAIEEAKNRLVKSRKFTRKDVDYYGGIIHHIDIMEKIEFN